MRHYKLTLKEISCPVCHCTEVHILYSVTSEEAVYHVLKDTDAQHFLQLKSHIETLWQRQTCDVVRCASCLFCFAHPYVAADERFYELVYSRSFYADWKWEYQVTYEILYDMVIRSNQKNLKLLEIGAGDGAFVKKVSPELIPKENVLCTEYSDYGRSEINRYGITCLSKDIREMNAIEYKGNFDVICMFQVLEHMNGIDALFEHLNWLTRKQATLFIAVPNPQQREFYDMNGILEDIPPAHIGRWNRRCFDVIAKRHSWLVIKHETERQSFVSKAIRFVLFRYEYNYTLVKQIRRIRVRPIRRLLKAMWLSLCVLASLPAINALGSSKLGVSQWVHLRKV